MKTKAYGGVDPVELQRIAKEIEDGRNAELGKANKARDDLFAKVPRDQLEKLYDGKGAEVPAEFVELKQATEREMEAAMQIVKSTDALLYPFKQLVAGLRYLESRDTAVLNLFGVSGELSTRIRMLQAVETVEKAFAAAGPELAKQLPMDQLALLKRNLAQEIEFLKAQEKDLKAKQPPPMPSFVYSRPDPVPDAVRVTLADVKNVATAAAAIEKALGAEGLAAEIVAASEKLEGRARDRFYVALSGYAILADTAANALDYGPVGPQAFGGHPRCKRSHEARRHDPGYVTQSQARQLKSRTDMTAEIRQALGGGDISSSMEKALVGGFVREAGFPAGTGADWNANPNEVRKALDENALVPLRCLYANVGRGGFTQYPPQVLEAMKKVLIEVAHAIAEGRYDEWRATNPEAKAQLGVLANDAEVKAWMTSLHLEKEADGRKVSSHEAMGTENFWATKVGGPSHGFDAIPHCVMSLVTNARTRVIMIESSDWHQTAARAYMRLVGGADGKGLIYIEGMETDFPLRETKLDSRWEQQLRRQVIDHAVAKAKESGAGLVFTFGYATMLRELGYPVKDGVVPFVLHPSTSLNEASDSLGPHDWVQTDTQTVYPRNGSFVLSAAQVAAL